MIKSGGSKCPPRVDSGHGKAPTVASRSHLEYQAIR